MFEINQNKIFVTFAIVTLGFLTGCTNSRGFRELTTGQSFDIHPAMRTNYHSDSDSAQSPMDRHMTVDVVSQIKCLIGVQETDAPAICTAKPNKNDRLELALMNFERATLSDSKRQRYRNAIIGSVLAASERNCGLYLSDLRGYQVTHQSVFGLLEIVVDAAGAVVTDAGSSRLLSGLSGVSTSVSSEIDSKIFASTAVDLTTAAIEQSMTTSRTDIQSNFTKAYEEWPLGVALSEVERMHQSCDMRTGLASIRTSGTAGTADSSAQVQLRQTAATNTARLLFKDLQLLNFQKNRSCERVRNSIGSRSNCGCKKTNGRSR